jgi:hypothetical protein
VMQVRIVPGRDATRRAWERQGGGMQVVRRHASWS